MNTFNHDLYTITGSSTHQSTHTEIRHHIMSRAVHTRSVLTVELFYKDTRLNAAVPIMQDA